MSADSMTSRSGRFGRASGGGEKMMGPSGNGQVATHEWGQWQRRGEEIKQSDRWTSGGTGSAGVSTVDPDGGGAGILEDERRDGAQSRSRRQTFSNDWLMHPEMMDARVKLTKCMEQMRVNQMWSHDLEQIWLKLRDLHEAKPAMSEMLQLNEQRRRAYVNAAELHDVRRKLDDELTLHLCHLNK